jgi:NitT/TauT family transport system substrate-binding protein
LRLVLAALVVLGLACQAPTASAPQPAAASKPSPGAAPSTTGAPAASSASAGAGGAPAARTTLEYFMIAPLLVYWPHYVAQQLGFYAAEDLEIQFAYSDSPSRLVQILVSGSGNLGGPGIDSVISAVERGGAGAELAIVAGEINKTVYQLITGPSIHGYADLRGQTLAVVGLREGSTVVLKRMLAANGLRDGDYDLAPVGSSGNRAAAIQNGTVAGGLLGIPVDLRMTAQGFPSLGLSTDYVPYYPPDAITTRRQWAQQNDAVLVRFLRAVVRAQRWLNDPANREEAARVGAATTNIPLEEALAAYELLITRSAAFPRDGEIDVQGVATVIETMAESDLLTPPLPGPDKYLDLRYLERARQ